MLLVHTKIYSTIFSILVLWFNSKLAIAERQRGARNALHSQTQTDCRVPCNVCDLPTADTADGASGVSGTQQGNEANTHTHTQWQPHEHVHNTAVHDAHVCVRVCVERASPAIVVSLNFPFCEHTKRNTG